MSDFSTVDIHSYVVFANIDNRDGHRGSKEERVGGFGSTGNEIEHRDEY